MTFSLLPYRDQLGLKDGNLLIANEWVAPQGGQSFDHVNPCTNETIIKIADASEADVNAAVMAARKAFDEGPWPRLKARERRVYMDRIAGLLAEHSQELIQAQTLDNGIPAMFGGAHIMKDMPEDLFKYYGGWIDKIDGKVHPVFTDQEPNQFISIRQPVGVVGAILPWNAPILQMPLKLAPALAAGCTVVVKPSEMGSLIALKIAEIINEADLPEGVFNVVTGGPKVGEALVTHPAVDKITFTGSKAVGGRILAAAGNDIKRVGLELGGKSASIVFPDAPSVEFAATATMSQVSMFLSGQVCSTTSRALVHSSIYDEFINHCEKQVQDVKFGNPFELDVTSAPIISKVQMEKVMTFIERGEQEGAKLVFGGDRPEGDLQAGNWVNPTLFADVDNTMQIAREEIFGPVLAVTPFETEEEAVRLANDNPYGLSGGLYTTNIGRALRVGKAVRTGTVGINGYSFMPNSPFGGFKQSGLGREGGEEALNAYLETKTFIINEDV